MSWEKRKGRFYYYDKQRIDGQVVSVYVGDRALAERCAAAVQLVKEARRAARAARREQDALDAEIAEASKLIAELQEAALLAAGYHQHKGEWRLRSDG